MYVTTKTKDSVLLSCLDCFSHLRQSLVISSSLSANVALARIYMYTSIYRPTFVCSSKTDNYRSADYYDGLILGRISHLESVLIVTAIHVSQNAGCAPLAAYFPTH